MSDTANTVLLTTNYRIDTAKRFIESISNNQLYLFAANHLGTSEVVASEDNPNDTILEPYYNMVFGKKITSSDAMLMIDRVNWQTNTIYTAYNHEETLRENNFYVVIKEGTQYDVFKCLENGNGNPSTVAPSRTVVNSEGDSFFYPTDGYRWKYMYSIAEAVADKFSTTTHFPVVVDANVRSQSVAGAIDVVAVTTPGEGYANYLNGSFGVGDIRLNGDPKKYGVSVTGAKTTNGFYNGCWLYVASGPGAGQARMIDNYTSNATHNFVSLAESFDPSDLPQNTSEFEISPSVVITGDGREISSAKARAIVDPEGNTVSRVEMLEVGLGYNRAGAYVYASPTVGITEEAGVVPVYSPPGGHGYNPPVELCGGHVGLSIKLVGNESNTILVGNDYAQMGILKNPLFSKVTLGIVDNTREFSTNEWVYKIETIQTAGTYSTTKNGNNVILPILETDNAVPTKSIRANDRVVVEYSTNYMFANVVTANSTTVTIDRAPEFDTQDDFDAVIHLATITGWGLVDGASTGEVILTNVYGEFDEDDVIIGSETGTYATVDSLLISDQNKGYGTFVQAYTYIGEMSSGQFLADEEVYQIANTVASARFHSIEDDPDTGTKRIYVTNQSGTFNTADDILTSDEIKGSTSGAVAALTNKYLPDIVFGTGEILYLENFTPITRSEEETETFKLVLQF
jgi:hypothetical protein